MTGDDIHSRMNKLKHKEPITDPESGDSQLSSNKTRGRISYCVVLSLFLFVLAIWKITDFGFTHTYQRQTTANKNISVTRVYKRSVDPMTEDKNICHTEDCIKSAKFLVDSMDKSIDPCEDFYQFTCGNYKINEELPESGSTDLFSSVENNIRFQILKFMKTHRTHKEPKTLLKFRHLFNSCANMDTIQAAGLSPIARLLNKLNLPLRKGADIWSVISRINSYTNLNYLFDISVQVQINNTLQSIIYLKGAPILINIFGNQLISENIRELYLTQFENNFKEAYESYLEASEKYFMNTWMDLCKFLPLPYQYTTDELKQKFKSLLLMTNKFREIEYYPKSILQVKFLTIRQLQAITNNITYTLSYNGIFDWENYILTMFEDVNNVELFDIKDLVIEVEDIEYVITLLEILALPNIKEYIEEHMLWSLITMFLPYTINAEQSYSEISSESMSDTEFIRLYYCASVVNDVMGTAVAYILHDTDQIKKNKQMLSEMMKNIHAAFEEIIEKLTWMDDESKNKTLFKARKMKEIINFPEDEMDPYHIEFSYCDLVIDEFDFVGNMLRNEQRILRQNLETFGKTNRYRMNIRFVKPYEVNAISSFIDNKIIVPVGILEYPFFGHNLQVLNYGYLGTIMGHEITHGFDGVGHNYDANGNLNMWWSEETLQHFEDRAGCFILQYNSFRMPGMQEKVDGMQTLNENIADNGGLRQAFWAYRKFVAEHGEEKKLPGLENFSNEQIFFLSFASNWCERAKHEIDLGDLNDSHSPKKVRATAALMNSDEFSQAWKCEKGTYMNPDQEKCRIW